MHNPIYCYRLDRQPKTELTDLEYRQYLMFSRKCLLDDD